MNRMSGSGLFRLALLLTMTATQPVVAQEPELPPVKLYAGLVLVSAIPTGELAQVIGTGWGLGGNLGWLYGDGTWSLRLDLGFAEYGNETKRVCLSPNLGCRVQVALVTSNSIAYVGLGPQLAAPRGRIRPYASAALGVVVFSTISSVEGTAVGSEPLFSTTNFSDVKLSATGLGGVTINLNGGDAPIKLDIGARYHRHGQAEYLTEGDIIDEPNGDITITPTRSDANFLSVSLGLSFGIRLLNWT